MKWGLRFFAVCLFCLLLPSAAAAELPEDVFTPEEVVQEDWEGGHWSYSCDCFAASIERIRTTVFPPEERTEQALVYYVGHLYLRNCNSFRSGLADVGEENSTLLVRPTELARRERAVIAITGDNMTQQEQNMKGALIRHGIVFSDYPGEAVLAMKDDLTMEIFLKGEARARDFLEMGIRKTYSFGPWLIKDGEPNPEVQFFRVNRVNPRVGVGMIEPGHFVIIVVDGRQEKHSYGLTLPEFRDLFVQEGCVQAYNLDGGCSTGLIFMGEHLNQHDGHTGAADYQRPWTDALLWGYSELVPTVDDPVLHNGNQEGTR